MWEFLDSNFFQTLVIFIVGLFAFIVYKLEKRDEKRKAASVVLNEIRGIEREIENIKEVYDFFTSSPVISTNSWDMYKYLFSGYLDEDEFKLINDLYKTAYRIEEQRNLVRVQIHEGFIEKSRTLQRKAGDIAINESDVTKFDEKIKLVHSLLARNTFGLEGNMPKDLINKLVRDCKSITTTTAGAKLKKVATPKLFSIF